MNRRTCITLAALGVLVGCTVYPVSLTEGPRPDPVFVDFSRTLIWPVEIELETRSWVALFSMDDLLSMEFPLVPVSRLEEIYEAHIDIHHTRVLRFRLRHPWVHPDSVPDPFLWMPPPLTAGRHELEFPYEPYIIQHPRSPLDCDYWLLVASDSPLYLKGLFELEDLRVDPSPEGRARDVLKALGLTADVPGWSATLQQGPCDEIGRQR
ncbi:MAG: hypothetical protein RQ745_10085 [Longimicrobiales bacterium]|nr:hypothetical protein [Longimicrobiales bacterium]